MLPCFFFFLKKKELSVFYVAILLLRVLCRPENMVEFGAFLVKHEVSENTIEHITKMLGTDSISLFANSAVSSEEVRSVLLADSPAFSNLRDLAAVRKAWRVAETMEKELHQPVQPRNIAAPEELDAPLETDTQAQLELTFMKTYGWPKIPANKIAADRILGRIRREFV